MINIAQKQKISTEELIERIAHAEHEELDAIIAVLRRRYAQLCPGWEVAFLSVPTGNAERRTEQAKLLIEFIQKQYPEAESCPVAGRVDGNYMLR